MTPLRLFFAAAPPPAVHEALIALQTDLRNLGHRLRWVRPEGIHLTLRFLGNAAQTDVEALRERAQAAAASVTAGTIELGGLVLAPTPRRPRVLWVEGKADPQVLALQSGLEQAALALGFAPEQRPFKVHYTLARFPDRSRGIALPAELAGRLRGTRFPLDRFVLFESTLQRGGSVYRARAEFPLARAS